MSMTLATDRLILRPYRAYDAWELTRYLSDAQVSWTLARVPHPYTLNHAHAFLAQNPEGFVITHDGALVGACGVHPRDKDGMSCFEIGYWIGKPFWGRGFASEAASALVGYWFGATGAADIYAGHFVDNPASGRVLEKIGFAPVDWGLYHCAARGRQVPHRWLRLTATQWKTGLS